MISDAIFHSSDTLIQLRIIKNGRRAVLPGYKTVIVTGARFCDIKRQSHDRQSGEVGSEDHGPRRRDICSFWFTAAFVPGAWVRIRYGF